MASQKVTDAKRSLKERRDQIDQAIADFNDERRQIEDAIAVLDGNAPAVAAPPAAPKPQRRKRRKAAGGGKAKATKKASGKSPAKAAAGASTKAPAGGGASTSKSTAKVRRRRRGGTRADQALKLITATPGMIGKDIAAALKVKPNYVYRVMDELKKDGRAEKRDGGKWFPVS